MEFDLTFLQNAGIDTELGMQYTGGRDKYLSALKRFYSAYDGNREMLSKFLDSAEIDNFRILVHALKSNSKMVGAGELSSSFETLEEAAEKGDTDFIKENGEKILLKYGEFAELIKPIGEADIEKPADEIDGERALELVKELLVALDDFDDEESMKLAKELSGYPFRLTQKESLNRAIKLISDFNYDDAAGIIEAISKSIQ
jgi:HPt (histidine-containing phosphotransfer) domain-containing protein